MPLVTLKQLLEAGVHFGHQTSRWNPKMKRYIFTARNGIHIIDLQQTVKLLDDASTWVKDVVGGGRMVLFIGTKKQAQESIELEARRSGMPFVNHRWMGGMLTNFTVMRRQIDRLNSLRAIRNDGGFTGSKKAITQLEEEYQRLERFFGGMAEMKRLPGAVYVVDPRKEHIAVTEARKLAIPIVAITDSNCDPDEIDHVIPGNDDAIRAVKLITSKIADAALEARQLISPEELTAAPEVPVTAVEFGAEEGIIATYVHHNHQLGVLVELNSESDFVARNDEFRHLAHEIAVHIAAAEPRYLRREDVSKDVLDRERAIFAAQASDQKKPPQVVEKIIQGKLNDFYKREVLLDQAWAKDDKRTVDQMLKEAIAKLGENITIARFARFKVGEAS